VARLGLLRRHSIVKTDFGLRNGLSLARKEALRALCTVIGSGSERADGLLSVAPQLRDGGAPPGTTHIRGLRVLRQREQHLASISVISSCWLPGLSAHTSFAMDATAVWHG
jgi:hypothetical protein